MRTPAAALRPKRRVTPRTHQEASGLFERSARHRVSDAMSRLRAAAESCAKATEPSSTAQLTQDPTQSSRLSQKLMHCRANTAQAIPRNCFRDKRSKLPETRPSSEQAHSRNKARAAADVKSVPQSPIESARSSNIPHAAIQRPQSHKRHCAALTKSSEPTPGVPESGSRTRYFT